MTGVLAPDLAPYVIIPDRELLNVRWQRVEKFPESPGGDGFHFDDGHSRRSPFADSLSASSKRKSSLPAAESPSICSSHRLCSRRRNHWTMCRYSSGARLSIAASISSTRLMSEVYHRPMPASGIAPDGLLKWKASSGSHPSSAPQFQTSSQSPRLSKIKAAPGSEAGAAMTKTLVENLFRAYLEAVHKTTKFPY